MEGEFGRGLKRPSVETTAVSSVNSIKRQRLRIVEDKLQKFNEEFQSRCLRKIQSYHLSITTYLQGLSWGMWGPMVEKTWVPYQFEGKRFVKLDDLVLHYFNWCRIHNFPMAHMSYFLAIINLLFPQSLIQYTSEDQEFLGCLLDPIIGINESSEREYVWVDESP